MTLVGLYGVMPFVLAPVLLFVGSRVELGVRSLLRLSLVEAQRADPRKPVLFLRAFSDDQIALPPERSTWLGWIVDAGRRATNLDQMLLEEVTRYGPVVALGNPKDQFPPYGAARGYFENKDWQQAVAELCSTARAIIICLNDTPNIWWEVEHIVANRYLDKTLVLIHPQHRQATELRAILSTKLGLETVSQLFHRDSGTQNGSKAEDVLGLFLGSSQTIQAAKSSTFSRFAFLLTLRWFLRSKLGMQSVPLPQADQRPTVAKPVTELAPRSEPGARRWVGSAIAIFCLFVLVPASCTLYFAHIANQEDAELPAKPVAPPQASNVTPPAASNITPQAGNNSLSPAQERALKPTDTFQECTNCPAMMVVPAGSFTMGSPANEVGDYSAESPQHTVTFDRQFAVGRFALTFDEWDACVADGGCNGYSPPARWGRGRQPMIYVSWDYAKAYVAWLSRKTGKPYRLLSEAEFEYAARAGSQTAYPWGKDIGKGNANCRDCGSQWDRKQTAPVGSFPANVFGLYDMVGNVGEWVEDCDHDNYNGAPIDGSAWTSGACNFRVMRGGCWYSDSYFIRSADRGSWLHDSIDFGFGFRVGRTLLTGTGAITVAPEVR